jgi:hypothetical protein
MIVTNTDEFGQLCKVDDGKIVAYLRKYVSNLTNIENTI